MKVVVWVVESGFLKGNRGFALYNPSQNTGTSSREAASQGGGCICS